MKIEIKIKGDCYKDSDLIKIFNHVAEMYLDIWDVVSIIHSRMKLSGISYEEHLFLSILLDYLSVPERDLP